VRLPSRLAIVSPSVTEWEQSQITNRDGLIFHESRELQELAMDLNGERISKQTNTRARCRQREAESAKESAGASAAHGETHRGQTHARALTGKQTTANDSRAQSQARAFRRRQEWKECYNLRE